MTASARTRWILLAALVTSVTLVRAGAERQYDLRQRPGVTTTDDPRRVPIPPRDTSKDPVLVLRGGTLIDGTGAEPVANAVVVVQGDRVVDVGAAATVPLPAKVDRVIDVGGSWILPGLIDLHIHFTQQRGDDFQLYRDSPAAAAIRGVLLAAQLIDGGITTARDVGTLDDVALKIKEAAQRHMIDAPRVFWAGKLIGSRGGHGDEITETASGRPRSLEGSGRHRVASGPGDWRLAVREQIRMGADLIKLTAPFTKEEVAAAIDEAHMLGIRVTADAFGDYVTWAVEAKIDAIEHPLAIPDAAIRAMVKNGTAFVPTMTAFYNPTKLGYPSAHIPPGAFYYTMSRRFSMTHEDNMETLRKARAAGVKVGIGTDIPFENDQRYPSDYFQELRFFREAGYTNKEILMLATGSAGEILGIPDKLGTLQKGRLADVLVVGGDPLQDIENLRKMRLVIADGRVLRDRVTRPDASSALRP
ncbi:MAG: amidohydrolase family protein [Acidobacteria bacterium]|nr:amidohydrolase family protein [Acidobacteriota bacterium]